MFGEIVRAAGGIALGGSDGGTPRREDVEQFIQIIAERSHGACHLGIGVHFHLFAQVTPCGGEAGLVDEAAAAQAIVCGVELCIGPCACAAVGAHRQAPVELAQQTDLGGVEVGADPGGGVAVAAVLAQHVAEAPHAAEHSGGRRLGQRAGEQCPAFGSQRSDGGREKVGRTLGAGGLGTEHALELRDGAAVSSGADGGCVGEAPALGHAGHHGLRVEHGERCGHHLARHLAHQRAAAGEVGGAVGQCHTVGLASARVEAELDVVGVALGREVDLPDHGLEGHGQGA